MNVPHEEPESIVYQKYQINIFLFRDHLALKYSQI